MREAALTGAGLDDLLSTATLPVLVDVSADWCVPCKRLAALLPALRHRFDGAIRIVAIDAEIERAFVERWSVRSLPSLLLFRGGACVDRMTGFAGYAAIVDWLQTRLAVWDDVATRATAAGWETPFQRRATQAEADYQAMTLAPAEAVGRVLGAAFEEHERLVAQLQADCAAGDVAAEEARQRIRQSHDALLSLGAPELAAQRQVTAAALQRYLEALGPATAELSDPATPPD